MASKFRSYRLIALFFSVLLTTIFFTEVPLLAQVPTSPPTDPSLSVTAGAKKTVLDNGLTVITKEVHTAPVVSVQVWYRVGARNEPAGQNGVSHQLEHLMFKGTTDRPIQFGRFFSALGSQSNAFTSYDETAYFGTVESNKLEAMLTLEADRMENVLIGQEQLDSERRVVISELQGYENNPNYRLSRAVMKAAFPDRPYGLPVGGTKSEVEKFTLEQVQNYYKNYYSPDNATLVITGDFDTNTVLTQVKDLFGRIAKRTGNVAPPLQPSAQASPTSQPPIALEEPGSAALLQMVYPLPDINHPDVPAIDVMDMILTGGRSSRLYQSLVEAGLASSVSAYPAELIDPGWYSISATAAPGHTPEEIDQVLQKSLTELSEQGVNQAELDRARVQLQASYVLSNQDITSQAQQLAYNQVVTGDYRYSDRYLEAVDRLTPADIQRVAQTYLQASKRTVGYFKPTLPNGQPGASSAGSSSRTVENFSPGEPVDPAEVARYLPPIPATSENTNQPLPEQLTLANGLKVLLLKDPSTPMINLSGWVDAGSVFDPSNKAGLSNFTASNLLNGTKTKDALTIAQTLEDEGADLSFSARREGVDISGNALSDKLPTLIQTLADVLQNASFPTDQLDLSRQRALTALKVELDDPELLGWRIFRQTVYPPSHPFYSAPTEATLQGITQADVSQFYQTYYRPERTALSLVGNFDSAEVRNLLNQAFKAWTTGEEPTQDSIPAVPLPAKLMQKAEVMPGKAEAVTYMGYYGGIARKDPRYYAALVLNQILGGDTLSSRLGTEIRDRQGLTYGIYSFFQAGINPGPFAIVMQTAPNDAQKAINSTIALLKQIRDNGVTQAELETAKRSITSNYPVDLANPSNVAETILSNDVLGLSADEIREFPAQINAVTMAQVQQVIAELIHPDNLVIVTAGPEQATGTIGG